MRNSPHAPGGSDRHETVYWIAPGTALCFSVLMAWLAPAYLRWFGSGLPALTRAFFAAYPLWIATSAAALLLSALGRSFPPLAQRPGLWLALDALLMIASVLIVAVGLIALFLPLLLQPIPE